MAKVKKSQLTKLEIIRVASRRFLEDGYSHTTAKGICQELDISTGNMTFYYPTKEHLLSELVDMLCDFQRRLMEEEANEGYSSVMALCLELAAMATMCEDDEIARDFYINSYQSPLCLDKVRKNDAQRAKQIFGPYCPDWTDRDFQEAENLVSGIEYATFMSYGQELPLENRIAAAVRAILTIYGVPEQLRQQKLQKLFAMDYHSLGKRVLEEFKAYVERINEQAFYDLLKRRSTEQ